jgi:V8-like Glu-specific endopeptidase
MTRWLLRGSLVIAAFGFASASASLAGPMKAGDVRPYRAETPHPYPLGAEGRPVVWTDTIVSPGAQFVRVHFKKMQLAPGDYLTIGSPDGRQTWTYTGRGPHDDGDVWAFAVDGDTAIVQIHGGKGLGHGYLIDAVGHGTVNIGKPVPIPEVLCGTEGREDVACHLPEIDAVQRPVARLLFTSGNFQYLCTGELIAGSNDSTLITNNHCISNQTETSSLQARFNFQRTACGGSTDAPTTDYAGGTFLKTNTEKKKGNKGGLDYTLLTLQGNPEATWGEIVATTKTVGVSDLIWFVQHGGGNQKTVGYYEDSAHSVRCKVNTVNATYGQSASGSQVGYGCDSEGGSSGSAITDPGSGHAIALHHYGGVSGNPCLNSGTSFAKICPDAGSLLSCVSN